MNLKTVLLSAIVASSSVYSATVMYGWEDGETILGKYSNIIESNVDFPVHNGSHSLQLIDSSGSATPQAYIAWIKGLKHGDIVTASFWRYDTTPGSNPSCRIWGHYTSDTANINSSAGTAGGNNDYGTGTGWGEVNNTWTFDTTGGRTGLVVVVRTYSDYPHTVWIDDMIVTAPDLATIDVGNLGVTPPVDTIDSTLVAYWSFEKRGKDFVIFDETNNGHDLVAINNNQNMNFSHGPWGRYLVQSENGAELVVRNSRGTFNFQQFTVETIVSPRATGDFQTIFLSSEIYKNTAVGYCLTITPEGNIRFSLSNEVSWFHHFSSTRLRAWQVYHIAVTYDGNEIKIYVDGVLDASTVYDTPYILGNGSAIIGQSIIDGRSQSIMRSPIDEIKIYKRAILEAEIAEKYQTLMK